MASPKFSGMVGVTQVVAVLLATLMLPGKAVELPGLMPRRAPTKGSMHGVVGDTWTLKVDTSPADGLDFLPQGELDAAKEDTLRAEVLASFEYLKESNRHQAAMLARGYYSSGKGFQKVGTVCLLLERFFSTEDKKTQECATWLATAYACFYDPAKAKLPECAGQSSSYYDEEWGGIAEKEGWDTADCNMDFGNACYNDHHYHFGYFVVSAAILAKLQPEVLNEPRFVHYVNTLIRDTTNPSTKDTFFPQFRSFDWFDLHSWSHGVAPMHDGKDQESTSEEINLLYGIHLWGGVTGDKDLQQLGSTMLTLASKTIREFFLMKTGNPYHPPDFVKNHVTGIFFQNKVHYTTWFGSNPEFVHGIQMLPLSPALQLTRTAEFCQQEWDDVLRWANFGAMKSQWKSVVYTGGLAMIHPEDAYTRLLQIPEGQLDNGLSRAWALYWAAVRPGLRDGAGKKVMEAARSLLKPVTSRQQPLKRPDPTVFPTRSKHPIHSPVYTATSGPKATNKFWTNWAIGRGDSFPIYPMPNVLKWSGAMIEVSFARPSFVYGNFPQPWGKRMEAYISAYAAEYRLGAAEIRLRNYKIVEEGLFGIHVQLSGPSEQQTVLFPIYTGAAYMSARYAGGLTPVVGNGHGFMSIVQLTNGIWQFTNRKATQFRVYVLDGAGNFVGPDFHFGVDGRLNKPLDGWVRIAETINPLVDGPILDAHARAIVTGCELDVESDGSVRYNFRKAGDQGTPLLHLAFGHHLELMSLNDVLGEAPFIQADGSEEALMTAGGLATAEELQDEVSAAKRGPLLL